ncbi:MAG: hypothetical protein ACYDCQ_11385 [Dehalococcoidia bacterium]
MAEQQGFQQQAPRSVINLVNLAPGTRLRLRSGDEAKVVSNPRDGMWLQVRVVEDGEVAGDVELVFADDIAELL